MTQISEIRRQVARTELFRGYRALPVAFSGLIALVVAGFQELWLPDPAHNVPAYLALWVGAALISVLARQSNSGFSYFTVDNRVLKNGGPPILLEPVKATVTIASRPIAAVNVLDHNGRRTDRTLPVTDGRFTLDGAKDKSIYYEVVFR